MDSRGPPPHRPQPHHQLHHHHHQQHQQHHQQPPSGLMMHHQHQQHHQQQHHHHQHQHHHHHQQQPNSTYPSQQPPQQPPQSTNNNSSNPQLINPTNSTPAILQNHARFPFNSSVVPNTQTPQPKPPIETLNSPYSEDGSSGLRSSGFGIDPNSSSKKKRGRPRKYFPDGGGNTGGGSNIDLGLTPTPTRTPTPISPPAVGTGGGDGRQADSGGTPHDESSKKHRGRPPSASKKQLDALGNCGVGFTPHVILVNAGEDIASKIVAFSKEGPRTVCVLSANGSICNVSLRQPALSGGVVNYEGRFEIISLSGSFLFSDNNGGELRTGGLSVSLAGTDGRVLGGGVAGVLLAATPVQIIVGSFIADGKKPKYMPSVPHSHMLNFAPPAAGAESPQSQEVSSEGSEENGGGGGPNHVVDRNMPMYGNSNHQMHNMQMYAPMGWSNPGSKMLQN